jgi:hypothetical protein
MSSFCLPRPRVAWPDLDRQAELVRGALVPTCNRFAHPFDTHQGSSHRIPGRFRKPLSKLMTVESRDRWA